MKFRTKIMFLAPFLLLGIIGFSLRQNIQQLNLASNVVNREDANREITVRIDRERWTSFQIPLKATTVRLMTNAAFTENLTPAIDQSDPRPGWRYAVEYQLIDASGELIQQSKYNFRSRLRQLIDSETGQIINPMMFGKSGMLATQTRMMQISIEKFPQDVVELRLKLSSSAPEIQEVVARVASRVERNDFQKSRTWNRISREGRKKISKFCVFDHDFLSKNERANLLRWHWLLATPVGKTENRFLYFIGDINDQEATDEQLPAGMYLEPGWVGTLPVPEGKGNLRLEFLRLQASGHQPIDIDIHWNGRELADDVQYNHRIELEPESFSFSAEGGLAEIVTTAPVVIRAFWDQPNEEIRSIFQDSMVNEHGEIEITPLTNSTRAFMAATQPIEFPISHMGDHSTPFRATFRYALSEFFTGEKVSMDLMTDMADDENLQDPREYSIPWEFVNADGVVVRSGNLKVVPELSAYDRIWVASKPQMVTDPLQFFFDVPAQVCTIRFLPSRTPLLVSGAVRPQQSASMTRVPEDYTAFQRSRSPFRSWFILKPKRHLELVRENRSVVLRVQPRPTELDPEIEAGDYQWYRFQPQGNTVSRQLLVPIEGDLDVRQTAVDSTFYELETNRTYNFSNHTSQGFQPRRSVIFLGDQPPGLITIRFNGRTIHEELAASNRGEIDLKDVLRERSGTIEIISQHPMRCFVGGCHVESAVAFLKRTASRFKNGKLNFQYEKLTDDDELLTMKIYRPATDSNRCQVRVEIAADTNRQNQEPRDSWTIRKREYSLRAVDEEPSLLMGANEQVDTGHRCFIKFGQDLPRGIYEVNVQSLNVDQTGYVMLYETRPGQAPLRKIETHRKTVGLE